MKSRWNLILRTMLCAASALSAHAACPSWPTEQRFVILGEEATDLRTGLVWKRCRAGQTITQAPAGDTCTGSAATYTHEQALGYANAANTADSAQRASGWRLPNSKELASLIDRGCSDPLAAIDKAAFPATSRFVRYWTASPYGPDTRQAWHVAFVDGAVGFSDRIAPYHVQLVRSSP